MKNITKTLFLILLNLFIISCDNNDDNESILNTLKSNNGLSFNENLEKWNELKIENGNSYTYKIRRSSVFGHTQTTTLVIQNDKVIARSFESYKPDLDSDDFNLILIETYDENESNLGENTNGAELKLIEDYYNDCSSEYLIVTTNNKIITFSTSDSGIITSCGYRDKRCADDCFIGYTISDFEWNKQ
ncbi:hypothetical protein C7447_10220 [Tenacibaculum adriaticum]|uniref:Uncharacterized protein n=1 Tax=Tenacibaculum adriaticum TaxID=413713 RepID=A0A5S5DSF5_9FLAO|nr:hypothetical protein [Tenacibaculum adriaticum]TYP98705.1 hypothetical protein C7447_10220 [Tenacibaculum adriaticum]